MGEEWKWQVDTGPFTAVGRADEPARFVLEQLGDSEFGVHPGGGFQYVASGSGDPIVVDEVTLPRSDLASVPLALTWFVSRHGRHTPAALVHDRLVRSGSTYDERIRADDIFLEAMERSGVATVRRHVMWAAVTAASRHRGGPIRCVGLWCWVAAALCGMTLLGAGLVSANLWWVVGSLVAPLAASALWGERHRAGMIAGYALPPVVFPALAALVGYGLYWVIEQAVRLVQAVRPSRTLDQLPAPPGIKEL